MQNVLAATYPDIFAAGIVYSGVPAGCFYTGTVNGWNSTCSQGNVVQTAAQWAKVATDMYPGYTGSRPKMQIYHGSVDSTLYPNNWNETMKQWSGVFGYSGPTEVLYNNPSSPYVKYVYGSNLEGIYGVGIGHSVPVMGAEDLKWFGFAVRPDDFPHEPYRVDCLTIHRVVLHRHRQPRPTFLQAPRPVRRRQRQGENPFSDYSMFPFVKQLTFCSGQAPHWGQCGGSGWTGPTMVSDPSCYRNMDTC